MPLKQLTPPLKKPPEGLSLLHARVGVARVLKRRFRPLNPLPCPTPGQRANGEGGQLLLPMMIRPLEMPPLREPP